MIKTRVYLLAKELGIEPRDFVAHLEKLGIRGKRLQSSLEDDEVAHIRAVLAAPVKPQVVVGKERVVADRVVTAEDQSLGEIQAREKVVERRVRANVIRRRKSRVEVIAAPPPPRPESPRIAVLGSPPTVNTVAVRRGSTRKPSAHMATLTVRETFKVKAPLLTKKMIIQAKRMLKEVYPLLYVFENSIRMMILRVMERAYGSDWWDKKVSQKIQRQVENRMSHEQRIPWHGQRGVHHIYYTDLKDLGIIVQNNWQDFAAIIPRHEWLTELLTEIGHSRNSVAHMNPLDKEDIERVKGYFRDWLKLIEKKADLLF